MTEQDVKGNLLALRGAIEHEDGEFAAAIGMNLLEGFLTTQIRIAEALEDIRQWGVGQQVPRDPE